MTSQGNNASGRLELDVQRTYSFVTNTSYYSLFLPFTLFGNTLSIAVVAVIVYHKRSGRSIADLLLGALALVDLFSLFTVHTVSLVNILRKDQHMSEGLSVFQAFTASVYMKMQFLIQICISLDRYLALVQPLQYNARFTSRRVMFVASLVLVTFATSSSALLAATCPQQVQILSTWPISLLRWTFQCIPHAVVASLTCIIFVIGSVVFICCNINLVRILWQYHSQREKINEFSHVVTVLEKKVSQHLQVSQSTTHKFKVNHVSDNSRSNSIKPPEVHVQTANEKDEVNTFANICNGSVNFKQQSSENSNPFFMTQHSMDNNQSDEQSKSNTSSVYQSASEGDDLENTIDTAKSKVSRTKNVNNLKIIVNLEEPTSSPEVGTPDSACNLIDKENYGKFSVENCSKLTPETPEIRIESPCDESASDTNQNYENKDGFYSHGKIDDNVMINENGLTPHCTNVDLNKNSSDGQSCDSSSKPVTPNTLEIHSPKPKKSVSFSSIILDACTKEEVYESCSPCPQKDDVTVMTHLTDYFHKVLKSWGKKTEKQRREVLLARLVAVCSSVYLATWIPYMVTVILSMMNRPMSPIMTDISLRLIFANAALNPIFYGLCRSNYRKGYLYISRMVLHYISCGLISKPGDDKIFFESKTKKVKRHLAAAEMNMHMRVRRQRRRAMSAHALQILQQLRQAVSPDIMSVPLPDNLDSFQPSNQLQNLFQQCMELEMSSDSETSSFDYDHMIFTDSLNEDFIQNLRRIWSLYDLESDPLNTYPDDDYDDLEFNYDDMISSDHHRLDEVFYGLNANGKSQGAASVIEGMPKNNHSDKTRNSSL